MLPARLLVIGGGYIGMELSQAFRLLGSEVVIIERSGQLAGREDADVATAIERQFAEDGIELALNARIAEVAGRSGEAVTVRLADGRVFTGSHLLVAAGRQPMTSGIGLDLAGVELHDRGFIRVDKRLQTSAPRIWAMGEVAGSPMFTHISLDDYRVAKSDIVGGMRTTAGRLVPYCVFIEPEFARVGLSETEARAAGIAYRLATLPMDVVPRAWTLSERNGFMKALVAVDSDRILGFAMFGAQAGEVMTAVQIAMLGGVPFTTLRDGILTHPTLEHHPIEPNRSMDKDARRNNQLERDRRVYQRGSRSSRGIEHAFRRGSVGSEQNSPDLEGLGPADLGGMTGSVGELRP